MRTTSTAAIAAIALSSYVSAIPRVAIRSDNTSIPLPTTSIAAEPGVVYLTTDDEATVYYDIPPSTIYATQSTTVYSCPPEVTNCPLRSKTVPVAVPSGEPIAVVLSTPAVSSKKPLTLLTIYAHVTHTKRVGKSVTPITDTIVVGTTICPVHEAASATAQALSDASKQGSTALQPIKTPLAITPGSNIKTMKAKDMTSVTVYALYTHLVTRCSPSFGPTPTNCGQTTTDTCEVAVTICPKKKKSISSAKSKCIAEASGIGETSLSILTTKKGWKPTNIYSTIFKVSATPSATPSFGTGVAASSGFLPYPSGGIYKTGQVMPTIPATAPIASGTGAVKYTTISGQVFPIGFFSTSSAPSASGVPSGSFPGASGAGAPIYAVPSGSGAQLVPSGAQLVPSGAQLFPSGTAAPLYAAASGTGAVRYTTISGQVFPIGFFSTSSAPSASGVPSGSFPGASGAGAPIYAIPSGSGAQLVPSGAQLFPSGTAAPLYAAASGTGAVRYTTISGQVFPIGFFSTSSAPFASGVPSGSFPRASGSGAPFYAVPSGSGALVYNVPSGSAAPIYAIPSGSGAASFASGSGAPIYAIPSASGAASFASGSGAPIYAIPSASGAAIYAIPSASGAASFPSGSGAPIYAVPSGSGAQYIVPSGTGAGSFGSGTGAAPAFPTASASGDSFPMFFPSGSGVSQQAYTTISGQVYPIGSFSTQTGGSSSPTSQPDSPFSKGMFQTIRPSTATPAGSTTTLTVLATSYSTVLGCPVSVKPCPLKSKTSAISTVINTAVVTTTVCPIADAASATSAAIAKASATGLTGYGAIVTSDFKHDETNGADYHYDVEHIKSSDKDIWQDINQNSQYHHDASEFNDVYKSGDFTGTSHRGEGHELSHKHEDGFKIVKVVKGDVTRTLSVPAATVAAAAAKKISYKTY